MAATFTGGCACGAIRYECSAEPVVSYMCHCRDCQKPSVSPSPKTRVGDGQNLRMEIHRKPLSIQGFPKIL